MEVQDGSGEQRELPANGVLSIGASGSLADWSLDAQGLAEVHCVIGRAKGGGWALKDMGSEYGTLINGTKVKSKRLALGDEILLGSLRLRVLAAQGAKSSAPAAAGRTAPKAKSSPAPKAKAPRPQPSPAPRASAPMRAPDIPGYSVTRPLGAGGMGQVFLAKQVSLDREVAVKVLKSRFSGDADFVQRFLAEARAAAALTHPNVVHVYDVGESGGAHYLSMEYMDRGNLEQRVNAVGPLPWREALGILEDASEALVFAEGKGIVHRDIKPENLMQNSSGHTKLADLGLATHLEADAQEDSGKKIFGTPHFISPEQARGERVDSRSDLYSLGATCYRLLTGRTPFEGDNVKEILRGHFTEDPVPPSELVDGLPADVSNLVLRLLAKDPDERPPSAAVLLREVQRLRSGEVAAGAPGPAAGLPKWAPAAAVGAILLILAVVIFGGGNGKADPAKGDPDRVAGGGSDPASDPALPDEGAGLEPGEDPDGVGEGTDDPEGPDDDLHARLREAEAENAYHNLPTDLDEATRITALQQLVADHGGTTIANQAEEEIVELRTAIRDRERAAEEANARFGQILEQLTTAQDLEADPPRPGPALRAMLAIEVPPLIAADPKFQTKRDALYRELGVQAEQSILRHIAEVETMTREGKFSDVAERLRTLQPGLDLPNLPDDLPQDAFFELEVQKGRIRNLLDELPGLEVAWNESRSQEDSIHIAKTLGGVELLGALRRFDFESARGLVQGSRDGATTDPARAWLDALDQDISNSIAALAEVSDAFREGQWRRSKVPDPRNARGRPIEVVGVELRGLLVAGSGGSELMPWSSYIGQVDDLHQLFDDRLGFPWTAEQSVQIESLIRLAAVEQAITTGIQMLDGSPNARLGSDEVRRMVEPFEDVLGWAKAGGSTERAQAERDAVVLLAEALRASGDDAWSVTVAGLERLLGEYPDTLVVRLLSDGRGLVE